MFLQKGDKVIEIHNENTAAGFMANGWRPVHDVPAPAAADVSAEKKPARRRKE